MAKGDQINPAQSSAPMWQQIAGQNPSYPQSIVQQPPYPNVQSPMGPYNSNFYSMLQPPSQMTGTGQSQAGMGQQNPFFNQVSGMMKGFGQQNQSMQQPSFFHPAYGGQMSFGNGISGLMRLPMQMGMQNAMMYRPQPMMRAMLPQAVNMMQSRQPSSQVTNGSDDSNMRIPQQS